MKHIVYLSQAVHSLSDQDLADLLTQCRRNNVRSGVTGILFYSHGHIAQLFEGEPAVVDALFACISCDGRHSNIQKLIDRPIRVRSFAKWSMAFHPLAPAGFGELQGFLLPTQVPQLPATLNIADAMLVELVRLAVFGPDDPRHYLQAFLPPEEATDPDA